jgi:hypothetical protein
MRSKNKLPLWLTICNGKRRWSLLTPWVTADALTMANVCPPAVFMVTETAAGQDQGPGSQSYTIGIVQIWWCQNFIVQVISAAATAQSAPCQTKNNFHLSTPFWTTRFCFIHRTTYLLPRLFHPSRAGLRVIGSGDQLWC